MKQKPHNNNEFQNAERNVTKQQKNVFSKKQIFFLSILAVGIGLSIWDIADPPLWWQFKRRSDKQAILQYAKSQYDGEAKVTGSKFPILNPGLVAPPEESVMYFKYNGIDFALAAQNGKLVSDSYYAAKAEKYIRVNFIDDFMNKKGISPQIKISFFDGISEELPDFKGHIGVYIVQEYVDEAASPKQIDWFYDFYQYWMNNCDLPDCSVTLTYLPPEIPNAFIQSYNVMFQKGERSFADEAEFYNSFR